MNVSKKKKNLLQYTVQPLLNGHPWGNQDSGHLKGADPLIEVKTIEKPDKDFDYWLPNRGGRLIGGHLIGVRGL